MSEALLQDQAERQTVVPADHRGAVLAGFLGWTLDAFDFFLVVLSATAIADEFHRPVEDILLTLTFTLFLRPVGAFIFGLIADRYGRRLPLMLDLVFYSIIEILSGLAPNYTTFLILRALFGIGMGGEWGVGASLAMEKVPAKWRGVLSGLLQEGYAVGYLLAAICAFFFLPHWRPLFFLGGLPALLVIYVRFGVKESEVWERTKQESWSQLGRAIVSHWKILIYLVILMMMMNLSSHGTQDIYPTFLKDGLGFSPQMASVVTAFSMAGAIAGGIAFGLFSDRWGRRRAMVIAFILAILVIPLWAFAPSLVLLFAGAFLIQFMVQGAWGVIPAHISELSPDSVRGFLPGFAYQCGALLAGPSAYVQKRLANEMGYTKSMALSTLLIFSCAAVVCALGRERRGITFGLEKAGR